MDTITKRLYKLNLHSHTRYSDGHNTIKEMALMSQSLGFCCHVITDHYYGRPDLAFCSLNKETYLKQVKEAAQISAEMRYPIIVGIECGFNCMEEINVFGHDAILYLMDHGVGIEDYRKVRDSYYCAMILNHPSLDKSLDAGVPEAIVGFERYSSAQDFFKGTGGMAGRRLVPDEFRDITQFANSDAHQIGSLDRTYNLIDEDIFEETHLINFIKNKKPLHHSVQGRIK